MTETQRTNAVRWVYGLTTVPSRLETVLPRTLKSLAGAGFPSPRLFLDGCDFADAYDCQARFGVPVTARIPRLGLSANWCLSAVELYLRDPKADRYALFQDDLVAVRNLRQYLEAAVHPPKSYLNLFAFLDNESLVARQPRGWIEAAELTTKGARSFHGRRQQAGRGAVALVFSREALTTLFLSPHFVHRPESGREAAIKIDGGIVESMNQAGWREYVHNPSLVKHTGKESTKRGVQWRKNASSFPGESFDAMELLK